MTGCEHHKRCADRERASDHAAWQKSLLPLLLVAVATCCGAGCAIVGERFTLEEQFAGKDVQKIRNGETTEKEILEWFGAPLAIAQAGAVVKIPRYGLVPAGSREIPAESVFSQFPEAAGKERLVAYYYRGVALTWADVVLYEASFTTQPTLEVTELWVLIDDSAGAVIAHRSETTEFETCGFWRWCRDDEEPRPKKRPAESGGPRADSGQPWEGAP